MQWLEQTIEKAPEVNARRGPPRLPGLPDIPPMPVPASQVPTNTTIEVEASWLEIVEERRAKNVQQANAPAPVAKPTPAAPTPKKEPAATRPRPRIRPIIPREDE